MIATTARETRGSHAHADGLDGLVEVHLWPHAKVAERVTLDGRHCTCCVSEVLQQRRSRTGVPSSSNTLTLSLLAASWATLASSVAFAFPAPAPCPCLGVVDEDVDVDAALTLSLSPSGVSPSGLLPPLNGVTNALTPVFAPLAAADDDPPGVPPRSVLARWYGLLRGVMPRLRRRFCGRSGFGVEDDEAAGKGECDVEVEGAKGRRGVELSGRAGVEVEASMGGRKVTGRPGGAGRTGMGAASTGRGAAMAVLDDDAAGTAAGGGGDCARPDGEDECSVVDEPLSADCPPRTVAAFPSTGRSAARFGDRGRLPLPALDAALPGRERLVVGLSHPPAASASTGDGRGSVTTLGRGSGGASANAEPGRDTASARAGAGEPSKTSRASAEGLERGRRGFFARSDAV